MANSGEASASGQGGVITSSGSVRRECAGQLFAQGGIIHGEGQVIRKDGTVVDFILTSDPLTEAEAEQLNSKE